MVFIVYTEAHYKSEKLSTEDRLRFGFGLFIIDFILWGLFVMLYTCLHDTSFSLCLTAHQHRWLFCAIMARNVLGAIFER